MNGSGDEKEAPRMNQHKWILRVAGIFILLGVALGISTALAEEVSRITKEELKSILGNPDVIVIDVRSAMDWKDSKEKIKGAVREDPQKASSWVNKYPQDKTLIFYCA
jgi:hypothetical protein